MSKQVSQLIILNNMHHQFSWALLIFILLDHFKKLLRSQHKAQAPFFIDYLAGLKKRHAIIYRKSFSLFFNDCSDEERAEGALKGVAKPKSGLLKHFFNCKMEPLRAVSAGVGI